jgi:antitoxin component of MazEF toxin-antitoxin module
MVVSLPRKTLADLHLQEGSTVSVELDREQHQIIITPTADELEGVDREFAQQVAEFIDQYRPALEALAR